MSDQNNDHLMAQFVNVLRSALHDVQKAAAIDHTLQKQANISQIGFEVFTSIVDENNQMLMKANLEEFWRRSVDQGQMDGHDDGVVEMTMALAMLEQCANAWSEVLALDAISAAAQTN